MKNSIKNDYEEPNQEQQTDEEEIPEEEIPEEDTSTKKNSLWKIFIGLVLIGIQVVVYSVNGIDYFNNIPNFAVFIYDLLGFTAYSLTGIIGITLCVFGILANLGLDLEKKFFDFIYKDTEEISGRISDKPTQKTKVDFKNFLSYICSKKKTFVILAIVSSSLVLISLISLIAYNVCDSNMWHAYRHYESTKSYNYEYLGCGSYYCKYCEGQRISVYTNHSQYSFRYYIKMSDTRTVFERIGVISLVLAIVHLVLLAVCLIYKHANKLKFHKSEQVQLPNPPSATNLERKFCIYCGEQIDTDSIFCPCCGENITKYKNENSQINKTKENNMNYTNLIIKNGKVTIPSIFMFEHFDDVTIFLNNANKMNCTVIFENENIEILPGEAVTDIRYKLYAFSAIIANKEIANAYLRYLGNIEKMSWDKVHKEQLN